MNILFLTQRVPFPPHRGDKLRAYHILKSIAKKHKIWLFSMADVKSDLQYKKELSSFCHHVEIELFSPFFKKITSFSSFFSGTALTFHYFYSRKLKEKINKLLSKEKFDVIYVYSSSMVQYIPDDFKGRIIMDFIDADSDKWEQYARFSRLPWNKIYKRESTLIREVEKDMLKHSDVSLVVSEKDKEILQSIVPSARVEVTRNGVDIDSFSPRKTSPEKFSVVFTGIMDYFPNVDGVEFFIKHIWLHLKNDIPQAKFYIVGGNPLPKIKRLESKEDIYVTGYVPDIREYLQKASVCVVPLRIARGIQNKILEALAMGVPVITTGIAAEGLNLTEEHGLLVADDITAFLEKTEEVLNNDELRQDLSSKAINGIRNHYTWDAPLRKVNEIIEEFRSKDE